MLERFAAGFCECIITLSDVEREDFLARGIGNKDKFITIHNGIDLESYEFIDDKRIEFLKKELAEIIIPQ